MAANPPEAGLPGVTFPSDWPIYYDNAAIDHIVQAAGGMPEEPYADREKDPATGVWHDVERDRRTALAHALEAAATMYLHNAAWNARPSPSKRAAKMKQIEKAAQRLLSTLGAKFDGDKVELPSTVQATLHSSAATEAAAIGGFKDFPPEQFVMGGETFTDWNHAAKLRSAVRSIEHLRAWAALGSVRATLRVRNTRHDRHKGDAALNGLVRDLLTVWVEIMGRDLGTSTYGDDSEMAGHASGPLVTFLEAALRPLSVNTTRNALRERVRALRGRPKDQFQK